MDAAAAVFFCISLVAFEESIRVHSCPFVVPEFFSCISCVSWFNPFVVPWLPVSIRGSWTSLVKTAKARDVEAAEDGSTPMRG